MKLPQNLERYNEARTFAVYPDGSTAYFIKFHIPLHTVIFLLVHSKTADTNELVCVQAISDISCTTRWTDQILSPASID